MTPSQTTLTFQIPSANAREEIKSRLISEFTAEEQPPPQYTEYRLKATLAGGSATIIQYTSGKLVVQGKMNTEIQSRIGEIVSGPTDGNSPGDRTAVSCIGMDECGKGDYFGPLVLAAVHLEPAASKNLSGQGVADSKKLDDRKIPTLAEEIRSLAEGNYRIRVISPPKYNDLYETFRQKGKNLNHLMGSEYAVILEELLGRTSAELVIIDKFGPDARINDYLGAIGNKTRIRIETKAEKYTSVAAASILARDAFLKEMDRLSVDACLGFDFPKGATHGIIETGRKIVESMGRDGLRRYAKLHFKTTGQILSEGLPS